MGVEAGGVFGLDEIQDDLSQPSNCSRITWQLAQAAGLSVR